MSTYSAVGTRWWWCGTAWLRILIFKNIVKYLLDHWKTRFEDDIGELGAAKDTPLHILKLDILEPEDLLGVVIGNHRPWHSANLALHNVFKKTSTDKIIEFSLVGGVLSLVLHNFVIQIIDVVKDLVTKNWSSSSLQLKDNIIAILIYPLTIDLRSQEKIAWLHVAEVVFFIDLILKLRVWQIL